MASLLASLAPVALNLVSGLLSSGKEKEKESENSSYRALADAALSRIISGQPMTMQLQNTQPMVPMKRPGDDLSQMVPYAVENFQSGMARTGNPVLAGLEVARSMYDNRDQVMQSAKKSASGLGSFVKGIWNKFWNNKSEIVGNLATTAMDYLSKRPRYS